MSTLDTAGSASANTARAPGATPQQLLDRAVTEVAAQAGPWVRTGAAERARLLDEVVSDTHAEADAWVRAAIAAKGIRPGTAAEAEEWQAGPGLLIRNARLLAESMRDMARVGRPCFPGPVCTRPDGQVTVRVFPASLVDRLGYPGVSAEVWMQPEVTAADVRLEQAGAYSPSNPPTAQVVLVLAAGNVASLGPRDVLSKLFADNRVVVMKTNPVNDYLLPHWQRSLRALVEAGVVRIVAGGADVGAYLCTHPDVDEIHITGSDRTHDAILFGPGADGAARKARGERLLDKPITSELGNVSPVIVVPGDWSEAELRYQAEHVATMLANNGGFNCLTVRTLVTARQWPQRERFLQVLAETLSSIPARQAYYPGAQQRYAAFLGAHEGSVLRPAEPSGAEDPGTLPWTLLTDVDPADRQSPMFTQEAFCALTAETALDGATTAEFLDNAVRFCNETLWGTLSATILAQPASVADQAAAAALDRAVAGLRYGSIGVNVWHALSFAIAATTWGAYPGHADTDIQSGRGVVGNTYLFGRPQKSVVRGPWRARPKPPWFVTSSMAAAAGPSSVHLEAEPGVKGLASALRSAVRRR